MGAYSPAFIITEYIQKKILEDIIKPTVKGMKKKGVQYTGCLYLGGMLAVKNKEAMKDLTDVNNTEDDINKLYKNGKIKAKVIEYNCRFGDPEAQVVLGGVKNLAQLLKATCEGELSNTSLIDDKLYRVIVALVSGGYPGPYKKGYEIKIGSLPADAYIIHAGTKMDNNKLFTNGGRVLGVIGCGNTLADARMKSYEGVKQINWEGMHYRGDIASPNRYRE